MDINFSGLLGKTLSEVRVDRKDQMIYFTVEGGTTYALYHSQDCCETVVIDDINGDVNDLVGSPITLAEESTSREPNIFDDMEGDSEHYCDDSFTWTFYRLATVKGYVNIRWHGSSNGYYSESVNFSEIGKVW